MLVNREYQRIEAAIRYIAEHYAAQPDLATVARAAHLSPHHFNRLFRRWAGVTPKQFLKFVTLQSAKEEIEAGRGVLGTATAVGLSGPGRLHDLFVTVEAITPGEYRRGAQGLTLRYGWHDSPFGACLVALSERGICHLSFHDEDGDLGLADLAQRWPGARLAPDEAATAPVAAHAFGAEPPARAPLPLHLKGTNFQLQVWQALLRIPPGRTASYGELAVAIGRPGAARAVGGAVGANPVAFLIPCHRVLSAAGLGGYRWGVERKRVILARESLAADGAASPDGRMAWLAPSPGP
jgi:AraC family transcriptional regulator of adaptative response/methylated-DNA-[protein]-cysteine methyltransferase